jgi:hypothetical protein
MNSPSSLNEKHWNVELASVSMQLKNWVELGYRPMRQSQLNEFLFKPYFLISELVKLGTL